MPLLLAALNGKRSVVWLDAVADAGRPLEPGASLPWQTLAPNPPGKRKARGLPNSAVVGLDAQSPIAGSLANSLAKHPVPRKAMMETAWRLFPLKVPLTAKGLRFVVTEELEELRAHVPDTLLMPASMCRQRLRGLHRTLALEHPIPDAAAPTMVDPTPVVNEARHDPPGRSTRCIDTHALP